MNDNSNIGTVDFLFATTNSGFGNKISVYKETFNTAGFSFFTQYGYATPYERMRITALGNVGIGTTNPVTWKNVRYVTINGEEGSSIVYQMQGQTKGEIGHNGNQFCIFSTSPLCLEPFSDSNNVLIGKTTQTNTSYKLDVAGKIRADEIVVNTTGADFVFDSTYNLRSLPELETFIKQNKHLPEIAPAKEMQENGVSAGEMQTKLLQKIEELTLYVIELKKENEELKNAKNSDLKQALINLEKRISSLENK